MPDPIQLHVHEWSPERPNGRTAVLVHGMNGWHRTWWRVGPALAERGWRVLAVDQRGHGRSPRIGRAATLDDLADDLATTIKRHATPPVDLLVGHSLGAAVSLWLVHLRPDIARRLVAEDPPSIDRSSDEDFFAKIRADVAAARDRPDDEVRRELQENPRWLEEDARQDVEGRGMADAEGIVASLRRPRPFHVVDLAPTLQTPTLFVLADEGRSVMLPEARAALPGRLPKHSRVIAMDAGHTVHRDRVDEYLAAILAWADGRAP
jgi:pimeloyl-ACP methyl ester carboxylesterase